MSYRQIRNFNEMMRALGYPQLISMQNFNTPNFELVAHALYWLVKRYDPDAQISQNIEEESDRVDFIKSVCQLFYNKAHLKLNIKRIYEARNFAVRQMVKIVEMLYKAMNASSMEDDDSSSILDFNISSKLHNLKSARELSVQITETGARLYDLIGKEKQLRDPREKALEFLESISRNLDSNTEQQYIEKCIRDLIQNQQGTVEQMKQRVENLRSNQISLNEKIKRRQTELQNSEKRLAGLKQVRPQYMDDYERREQDLKMYYAMYVDKFRNLDFVERQLDEYTKYQARMIQIREKQICDFGKVNQHFFGDQQIDRSTGGQIARNEKMAGTSKNFNPKGSGGLEHDDSSDEEMSGSNAEEQLDSDQDDAMEGDEDGDEESDIDDNIHNF